MWKFEELKKEFWVDEKQAKKIDKAIRIYQISKAVIITTFVVLIFLVIILLFIAIIKFLLWYIF